MRRTAVLIAVMLLPAAGGAYGQALFTPGQPPAGKYLHFLAGMAAGFESAGIFECALGAGETARSWPLSPVIALSGSALAGIAKEILDSTGFGDPRLSDALITTAGGLVAAGAMLFAHLVLPPDTDGWAGSQAFAQTSAVLLSIPVAVGFIVEIERYKARRAAAE
jgi:hypothetical protein